MKKIIALVLAAMMVLSLAACGAKTEAPAATQAPAAPAATEAPAAPAENTGAGKSVGIAMPTQSYERWIKDGGNMKAQLEAKGFNVILQYG